MANTQLDELEHLTREQLQAERDDQAEQLAADLRLAEDADQTATFLADPMLDPAIRDALAGANVRWRRDHKQPKSSGSARESTEADVRRIYVGTAIPPTTAAALGVIPSIERLWCALAELEPAGTALPTASLGDRIAEHEAAIRVLQGLLSRYGQKSLSLAHRSGVTIRFRVLGAAIEAITKITTHELAALRSEHDERTRARQAIAAANANARGARGPAAEPERRRRMLAALSVLRVDAAWERRRIAELVFESSAWEAPPCREYVRDLLDGYEREAAIDTLAERLRVTERRNS